MLRSAVSDILITTYDAYANNDLDLASRVEPIEQIVDELRDKIRLNHIMRLQKSECTIELGFVLSDLLTNFERVSDHCSNIASCIIEISEYNALDMHKYLAGIKQGSAAYEKKCQEYREKYTI